MSDPVQSSSEQVLVVDDEPDLCGLVVFNLREAGFAAAAAMTGADGLAIAAKLKPAVIVLDVGLPDILGTEVCRRIRADPAFDDPAVLMLTARGDEDDRLAGLDSGADDYVVKPFMVKELVARVRVLARRAAERRAALGVPDQGKRLRWRTLEVDPTRHRVFDGTREIELRPMEYKILSLLMENRGRVFTRDQLLDEVWGDGGMVSPRTVDTHIRRLRSALGNCGDAVETVHGFGYRLRDQ